MINNYPPNCGKDAPWLEKDREPVPFDEYELDSCCELCDTEGVTLDSKRRCKGCYENDPEYYEGEV